MLENEIYYYDLHDIFELSPVEVVGDGEKCEDELDCGQAKCWSCERKRWQLALSASGQLS